MTEDAGRLPKLGVCYDRLFPAAEIVKFARAAEEAGVDSIYTIEDCFFDAGVPLAAAALAATDRIEVGVGIMPAVARTAAITAMSIATLSNLGGGRFVAGIGHGVQSWMGQMGVRPDSPLTALEETFTNVRRLLAGEEVTTHGRYVHLDEVKLVQPPLTPPPMLAGVQGPRSMQLAGKVADGVILVEGVGANYVRWAFDQAGRTADDFAVVTYTICVIHRDPERAYAAIAPFVADAVRQRSTGIQQLSCFAELESRVESGGSDALLDLPTECWREFGAIGTIDDAVAHVEALAAAGVDTVALYPGPKIELGYAAIDTARELRGRMSQPS